jgi:hypothetical protein
VVTLDATVAAFHGCDGGDNRRMYRAPISPVAVAFLLVVLFVCAVVSGAALAQRSASPRAYARWM